MIKMHWPYRQDWEFKTIYITAGVLFAALCLWVVGVIAIPEFTVATIACAIVILKDARTKNRMITERQQMNYLQITPDELAAIAKNNPHQFYLGEGYELSVDEGRAIYMASEHGLVKNWQTDNQNMNGGDVWLRTMAEHKPIYIPNKFTEAHIGIFGTTGAGKTRCLDLVINQCLARKECAIIIDPKGDIDLQNRAEEAAARAGVTCHKILLAFPELSKRLNPLRNGDSASELATRISSIMASESGNDPFKAVSHMALEQIIGAFMDQNKKPTLSMIFHILQRGPDTLVVDGVQSWAERVDKNWMEKASMMMKTAKHRGIDVKSAPFMADFYLNILSKEYPNKTLDGLISQYKHDKTHFDKMVMSLLPVLSSLTSQEFGPMFSPDPDDPKDKRDIINLSDIMNRNEVLYIGLSILKTKETGATFGSIICSDITACAGDRYNYTEKSNRDKLTPVNLFIDEAGEVINDPLIQTLNKARGAKFCVWMCAQTEADYVVRFGKRPKANMIFGNVNNTIAFRVQDQDTQTMIASKLPQMSVIDVLKSYGENSGGIKGDTRNTSYRQSTRQVPVFPPSLFGSMPNLDYILKMQSGKIIKGRIPLITDRVASKP